jgi:hypothetical protein
MRMDAIMTRFAIIAFWAADEGPRGPFGLDLSIRHDDSEGSRPLKPK